MKVRRDERSERVTLTLRSNVSRLLGILFVAIAVGCSHATPRPEPTGGNGSNCTPGYFPCLPPASDYDCIGGSGDGPEYTGLVTVTGSDPYGLDANNDGVGCEA